MTAAFIRRLTLTNFRSYHAAQISLDRAGPVVLTGAEWRRQDQSDRGDFAGRRPAAACAAPPWTNWRFPRRRRRLGGVGRRSRACSGLSTLGTGVDPPSEENAAADPAQMPDRPRSRSPRPRLSPNICAWCGSPPAMDPAVQRTGVGAAAVSRSIGIGRRCSSIPAASPALERSLRSRNRPVGRSAQRSALA